VRHYGVDMSEAAEPDIAAYPTFNEFFTRALKPACDRSRPATSCARSTGDQPLRRHGPQPHRAGQGHHYLSVALVGGDEALATQFDHGSFATLYLAPKDYHRIHMPCDGTLARMIHVPGRCSR
jgi:phosphatidylserine decarboxylase